MIHESFGKHKTKNQWTRQFYMNNLLFTQGGELPKELFRSVAISILFGIHCMSSPFWHNKRNGFCNSFCKRESNPHSVVVRPGHWSGFMPHFKGWKVKGRHPLCSSSRSSHPLRSASEYSLWELTAVIGDKVEAISYRRSFISIFCFWYTTELIHGITQVKYEICTVIFKSLCVKDTLWGHIGKYFKLRYVPNQLPAS